MENPAYDRTAQRVAQALGGAPGAPEHKQLLERFVYGYAEVLLAACEDYVAYHRGEIDSLVPSLEALQTMAGHLGVFTDPTAQALDAELGFAAADTFAADLVGQMQALMLADEAQRRELWDPDRIGSQVRQRIARWIALGEVSLQQRGLR